MPSLNDFGTFWNTLKEVDLNAIAHAADEPFHLAIIGRPGAGKRTLIEQLRTDARTGQASLASVVSAHELPLTPEAQTRVAQCQGAVLLVDATTAAFDLERAVFAGLQANRVPVVVAYNKADLVADPRPLLALAGDWMPAEVVAVAATDRQSLVRVLAPAVLRLAPLRTRGVAVARALPLFRAGVIHDLIEDAAFVNATYSFSTGLAEIVPILDVPFNLADMVVLTKNQALLAFKIALAMGLPSDWRQTVPQLAAVVGAGFLWRQLGRSLVGLIPGWGIVPKVGIAYAGTVAVGQAVYHWAETGEKLKPAALADTYRLAIERGKAFAQNLLKRRPALGGPKNGGQTRRGHCPHCNRRVPRDATWCPYCRQALTPAVPALPEGFTEAGSDVPPLTPGGASGGTDT